MSWARADLREPFETMDVSVGSPVGSMVTDLRRALAELGPLLEATPYTYPPPQFGSGVVG